MKRRLREKPLHHRFHFLADGLRHVANFRPKQRFRHDVQRQFPHLLVQVAYFSILPAREVRRGRVRHNLRIHGDVFMPECGLHQLPLRLPGCAFVRQQAISQKKLQCAIIPRLVKVRGVLHQHKLNVVRMRKLADRHMQKAVADNISVFPGTPLRMPRPTTRQFPRASQKKIPLRPGWEGKLGRHHSMRHLQSVSLCVARENIQQSDTGRLFVYNPLQHFRQLSIGFAFI